MFKAGFRLLYLGLESACDRVLDHMKKGTTKETAIEVCRNIHNSGIWNHLYVFFGFPTESRAEVQETIDFLISNKDIIRSFNIGSFVLYKGAPIMKCPQEYGISSIDCGQNADFNLAYNYTVSSGLTCTEAQELSNVYWEKIAAEYTNKEFLKLDGEDILLYLSHFEGSDSFLETTTGANITKIQSDQQLTRRSIPRINHNVVFDKLRFNIIDIMNNIANNKNMTVCPSAISLVYDPVSEKLCPTSLPIEGILALCDGKKSVQQICGEFPDKYHATGLTAEEDCISLLEFLSKEGYVLF
jgi:hypothetical protein